MPTDTCKLCLKPAELLESHLLPAAVYRMCRNESGELAEPIGVHNDPKIKSFRVFQSSRQITGKVLCFSCEQLLNLYGEDWVLPQLSSLQGFPLHDKLTTITPEIVESDLAAYAAVKVNEIRTNFLVHFAIGIFWKAAVHNWQTGHGTLRLEYGPYREGMRGFLLGGNFPEHTYLMISVVPPSLPTISAYLPYTSKTPEFIFHSFYVPGVEFMIALTKRPPAFLKSVCIVSNPLRPIFTSSFPAQHIGKVFAEAFDKGRIPAKAICSRYSLLKSVLDALTDRAFLGLVRYGPQGMPGWNLFRFVFTKRAEFADENEARALLWIIDPLTGNDRHIDDDNRVYPRPLTPPPDRVLDGHRRKVDLRALVTQIVVSPWASSTMFEGIAQLVRSNGYEIPVVSSELTRYRQFLPSS